MKKTVSWNARVAIAVAGAAVAGLALAAPAQAAPLWPGGPEIPGAPAAPAAPQFPALPQFQIPPQLLPPQAADFAPSLSPGNGEVVGGKRAIGIHFNAPIKDRPAAENGIKITSSSNTAGHFNWTDDSSLQWIPNDYWPRNTSVTVQAKGTKSEFKVSDSFEGFGDAKSHQFVVKIGGDVVRTFPAAFGKPTHETPNGTFHVLEKFSKMVMDSSTYGVPVDSPQGYKLDVEYATRLTWDGIFVHAAPWSVDQQGNSNVSHGCINLSTANAKWYFDNVHNGDAVTIVNA